jgi:hypothetical protein
MIVFIKVISTIIKSYRRPLTILTRFLNDLSLLGNHLDPSLSALYIA